MAWKEAGEEKTQNKSSKAFSLLPMLLPFLPTVKRGKTAPSFQ